MAAILVAGAVASAAPGVRGAVEDEPGPGVTATPPPQPTDTAEPTEAPEPTETVPPEPVTAETSPVDADSADDDATGEDGPVAPDFSTCDGLHGLENAICRHEALLAVQPDNVGLQNALARLEANLAKHEEQQAGDAETEAAEGGGQPNCPGKSCEAHANGNGHANGHGG